MSTGAAGSRCFSDPQSLKVGPCANHSSKPCLSVFSWPAWPWLRPVRVLRYFTPFEGILGEIFDIRWQGQPVIYEGPMMKRAAPGEEDWLLLKAGEALSATVDISGAWNLTRPGQYLLKLRNSISYRVAGEPEPRQLDAAGCGVVGFTVSRGPD